MERERGSVGRFEPARVVLPACLFVSGGTALAFEVVWAKYLTALVGSTALAHTVVLSTFMGGLAGGAWLFGRWADRTPRPLILYAGLEFGVALTCALFPLTMAVAGAVYVKVAAPLVDHTSLLVLLRASLAVVAIAIPSVLMGGTLPAVTRFYVRSISEVGTGVARLYFINALGAVLGCLLAGFALVPALGLDKTLWLGASINALAGLAAIALVLWLRHRQGPLAATPVLLPENPEADDGKALPAGESPFPRWVAGLALASIAISGAASMTYEIVWIRILTLVMGGSTYAFTTMLAAFILGIAIGSSLVSWGRTGLARMGLGGFGWLQVGVAAVTVCSVPLYNRLPYLYHRMGRLIVPELENYPTFLGGGFLVCLAVMILPTVLLGMTFPVAARLATRSIRSLGGGVGRTYACDTAGTVVGVVLAGHVLLPIAGIHGTLIIAALANLFAGLVCVGAAWRSGPAPATRWVSRRRAMALGLALGLLPAWMIAGPALERMSFVMGVFRMLKVPFSSYHEQAVLARSDKYVLYDRDGPNGTVTVIDLPLNRSMIVNGKTDASDGDDLETQYLAAHLPALVHPDPKRALVVGLGAGATSAGLVAHPNLEVVTAELSREITEAARYFEHVNRNVLDDPRFELVLDDVQAWLALSEAQFDLVVSVPSNPWVAGNASLFTVEFFDRIKDNLAPGGIFLQWFHDYEMTEESVQTILRTVSDSFPHVHLFHAGSIRDYLLVCSREPLDFDAERIDRRIAENALVRSDLEHGRIRTHLGIYARHLLDTEGVRQAGGEGPLQRRSRPLLEYQAPKGLFLREELQFFPKQDLRRDPAERSRLLLGRRLDAGAPDLTEAEWAEVVDAIGSPFHALGTAMSRGWAATGSLEGQRRLARSLMRRRIFGEAAAAYRVLEAAEALTPEDAVRLHIARLQVFSDEGHPMDAAAVDHVFEDMFEAAFAWNVEEAFGLVGRAARRSGRQELAARAFEAAADLSPTDAPFPRVGHLIRAAEARHRIGDLEDARKAVAAALDIEPRSYGAQVLQARLARE